MSRIMRKPTICICENKDADQLHYSDSTIPLLAKSKISSFWPSPVAVQPGLCQTWSESSLLVFSCWGSYGFTWHLSLFLSNANYLSTILFLRLDNHAYLKINLIFQFDAIQHWTIIGNYRQTSLHDVRKKSELFWLVIYSLQSDRWGVSFFISKRERLTCHLNLMKHG